MVDPYIASNNSIGGVRTPERRIYWPAWGMFLGGVVPVSIGVYLIVVTIFFNPAPPGTAKSGTEAVIGAAYILFIAPICGLIGYVLAVVFRLLLNAVEARRQAISESEKRG